jgi:hypothetical protein
MSAELENVRLRRELEALRTELSAPSRSSMRIVNRDYVAQRIDAILQGKPSSAGESEREE